MWRPLFVPTLFVLSLLSQPSLAEDVYKWVDDQGQTHYSSLPPKNKAVRKLKTRTGHSEPVSYTAAKAEASSTPAAPKKDALSAAESAARCRAARENLQTLRLHSRVRVEGDDGQIRYLSPSEHGDKVTAAQEVIAESCQG